MKLNKITLYTTVNDVKENFNCYYVVDTDNNKYIVDFTVGKFNGITRDKYRFYNSKLKSNLGKNIKEIHRKDNENLVNELNKYFDLEFGENNAYCKRNKFLLLNYDDLKKYSYFKVNSISRKKLPKDERIKDIMKQYSFLENIGREVFNKKELAQDIIKMGVYRSNTLMKLINKFCEISYTLYFENSGNIKYIDKEEFKSAMFLEFTMKQVKEDKDLSEYPYKLYKSSIQLLREMYSYLGYTLKITNVYEKNYNYDDARSIELRQKNLEILVDKINKCIHRYKLFKTLEEKKIESFVDKLGLYTIEYSSQNSYNDKYERFNGNCVVMYCQYNEDKEIYGKPNKKRLNYTNKLLKVNSQYNFYKKYYEDFKIDFNDEDSMKLCTSLQKDIFSKFNSPYDINYDDCLYKLDNYFNSYYELKNNILSGFFDFIKSIDGNTSKSKYYKDNNLFNNNYTNSKIKTMNHLYLLRNLKILELFEKDISNINTFKLSKYSVFDDKDNAIFYNGCSFEIKEEINTLYA